MKSRFIVTLIAAVLVGACGGPKGTEEKAADAKTPDAETAQAKDGGSKSRSEIALTPAQMAAALIEAEPVVLSSQPSMLQAKGRIVLADERIWRVGVRSPGLIMVVYAQLGAYVKKGQVLARYHADEVREERARYRTAIAGLHLAEAAQAQAQRNRDRAKRLLDLKAGSVQQLEQAEQDLLNAQSAVSRAQIEVDRGEDLLEDDLKVSIEPKPANAGEYADDVPIFAPESGYVIAKNVTAGKTVDLVTDTFVIGDLSKVWMLASVSQEDFIGLRVGTPATVTLPGDSSRRFPGKIANLGQQFDPDTRMIEVRIAVDNPRSVLKPEMLANAEIPRGQGQPVLLISSDSVQQINDSDVVFVETSPAHFSVRPIRTGPTSAGKTIVLEGLKAGEQVVNRGSFLLKGQLLKSTMEEE